MTSLSQIYANTPGEVIKATVSIGAATTYLYVVDPFLIAFLGVGFTTLVMSIAGSAFSFAFGRSSKTRLQLFFQFMAAAVIGAAAVTGAPELFNLDPVPPTAQPVVGFFYGLFARWLMPLLIEILPALVRRWFNLPEKP